MFWSDTFFFSWQKKNIVAAVMRLLRTAIVSILLLSLYSIFYFSVLWVLVFFFLLLSFFPHLSRPPPTPYTYRSVIEEYQNLIRAACFLFYSIKLWWFCRVWWWRQLTRWLRHFWKICRECQSTHTMMVLTMRTTRASATAHAKLPEISQLAGGRVHQMPI